MLGIEAEDKWDIFDGIQCKMVWTGYLESSKSVEICSEDVVSYAHGRERATMALHQRWVVYQGLLRILGTCWKTPASSTEDTKHDMLQVSNSFDGSVYFALCLRVGWDGPMPDQFSDPLSKLFCAHWPHTHTCSAWHGLPWSQPNWRRLEQPISPRRLSAAIAGTTCALYVRVRIAGGVPQKGGSTISSMKFLSLTCTSLGSLLELVISCLYGNHFQFRTLYMAFHLSTTAWLDKTHTHTQEAPTQEWFSGKGGCFCLGLMISTAPCNCWFPLILKLLLLLLLLLLPAFLFSGVLPIFSVQPMHCWPWSCLNLSLGPCSPNTEYKPFESRIYTPKDTSELIKHRPKLRKKKKNHQNWFFLFVFLVCISDLKCLFGSGMYPLTRNYYENNSLRIIFVVSEAFCPLEMSRKERQFPGITREIRNFPEDNYFRIIFRK